MSERSDARRPRSKGPVSLREVLTDVTRLRGLHAREGQQQLREQWVAIAGAAVAAQTQVVGIKGGILEVQVAHSTLLSELANFEKPRLLKQMRKSYPELGLKGLRFRLNGAIGQSAEEKSVSPGHPLASVPEEQESERKSS